MDQLQSQKAKIINYLIVSVALALVPVAILVIYFAAKNGWGVAPPLQLLAFAAIWILALKKDFPSPTLRTVAITAFLLLAALSEVYRYGLISATYPMLTVLPVLATVIGGIRFGLLGIGLIVVAMLAIAWVTITGERMPPAPIPEAFFSAEQWGVRIVNFAIASGIGVFVAGSLYRFHKSSSKELLGRNSQLLKSQSRIAQSAKLAGLGYALTNQKTGEVLECDTAFAEMHGRTVEEFTTLDIGKGIIGQIIHEDDRDGAMEIRQRMLAGEALISNFRHRLPDGQIRIIRKIFSPLNPAHPKDGLFEVVSQDVTETRKLQVQLFQTQKMDAIGKLTGGVAHDFNNLLAVILGNLELLDDELKDDDHKELVKSAIDATLRGSELTRNMLSFARRAPLMPTIIDLSQLVGNMKNWIERTLPSTIDVKTSLPSGTWPVKVDASSAEAGLLNLILNARDAMPGGGKLTIETSNILIGKDYLDKLGEEIEPGRYVLLAVSDTGEGIAPDDLERIFEPFFTTKPVGAGSGLGLSMLEGFMKQSGGTVRVYSEPNVGTTFKLFFAAARDNQDHTQLQQAPELPKLPDAEKRTTILLVEDNPNVLSTMRTTLEKSGFHVLDAPSGDEAFKVFDAAQKVDLLLTDIVMPGDLQGTTLAKVLRKMRPGLPVVFMSGYASEATVHGNGLRPQDIRLMKPVQRDDLLRAVERALAKTSNGAS